jgi:HEAT repeats
MKRSCLLIVGALVLSFSPSGARPIPWVTVAGLAEAADVIVLGQIVSSKQVGVATLELGSEKVPSRVLTAQLHAQEVMKGAPGASDITVRFLLPEYSVGYRTPPAGTSAIFFLTPSGQEYSFTSPYRPSIPGMPGAMPEGGTLLDQLAGHVRAVIESTEARRDQKYEAIFALGEIPGDRSTQALHFASSLGEPTLQLSAIAVLLMRNDISGLQVAADVLLRPTNGPASEVRENLLAGITQVKDPQAVSALAALVRGGDDRVRRAAAEGLWHTGSPNAIAALIRALDDPNDQVRYYAIIGLADITGQPDWRPNTDDFRDREASYLSYWKEWAKSR